MEVILLEKIRNLGGLGDRVKVKSGYGRNYLIPYGKAVYVTEESIKKFEARRAELEKIASESTTQAQAKKQALEQIGVITLAAKTGEEGKLFGSIGTRDIAQAITDAGVEVAKSEIHLPMGHLRQVGEYDITIELNSDVVATIKLVITPEA